MKLILTRHGETDFNIARRYQGQSDVPLNQNGIRQAEQIAKRLSAEKIDFICSSDLSRAFETARRIASLQEQSPVPQSDPRWRELDFGDWEGLNHEEMNADWHDEAQKWYRDPVNTPTPNGESLFQLAERTKSAIEDLKNNYKDKTVLVVSHSGVIQVLLCLTLGMELSRYWQFRVLQASLTVVNFYHDSAFLNLFNDVSHLQER
jgi:alpha-ribazole phosphatase